MNNDGDYDNNKNESFFTEPELSFCDSFITPNNLYCDADNDTTIVSNNVIDTNTIPINQERKIANVKNVFNNFYNFYLFWFLNISNKTSYETFVCKTFKAI